MSIRSAELTELIREKTAGIRVDVRIGSVRFSHEPSTSLQVDSRFVLTDDGNHPVADVRSNTHRPFTDPAPTETAGVSWAITHPKVDSLGNALTWKGNISDTAALLAPNHILNQPMTGDRLQRPEPSVLVFQPGPSAASAAINVRDPRIDQVIVVTGNPLTKVRVSQHHGSTGIRLAKDFGITSRARRDSVVTARLNPQRQALELDIQGADVVAPLALAVIAAMTSGTLTFA